MIQSGDIFGRLTVVDLVSNPRRSGVFCICLCTCGMEKVIYAGHLRAGQTVSCGTCPPRPAKRTHEMTGTPEYRAWDNARHRCSNPGNRKYPVYGGRGIRVCDRWRNSFENFLADMGKKPSAKHSLDRIDNDGHYAPDNCRWATSTEQNRNRTFGRTGGADAAICS